MRRHLAGYGNRAGAGAATRTVYVETYGCQMNVADSDLIGGVLAAPATRSTDEPTKPT